MAGISLPLKRDICMQINMGAGAAEDGYAYV